MSYLSTFLHQSVYLFNYLFTNFLSMYIAYIYLYHIYNPSLSLSFSPSLPKVSLLPSLRSVSVGHEPASRTERGGRPRSAHYRSQTSIVNTHTHTYIHIDRLIVMHIFFIIVLYNFIKVNIVSHFFQARTPAFAGDMNCAFKVSCSFEAPRHRRRFMVGGCCGCKRESMIKSTVKTKITLAE